MIDLPFPYALHQLQTTRVLSLHGLSSTSQQPSLPCQLIHTTQGHLFVPKTQGNTRATHNHTWLVSHSLSHQTKLATETFHPYTIHIWELCSGSVGFIRAPGLRVMSWINIVGPSSNIIFTVSHLTYFLLRPPAEAHVQNHVLDYILE